MAGLAARNKQPELMDQPGLEVDQHRQALRALARINWISGSAQILWPTIRELAKRRQPLRVLDIATGGGDVPIRLHERAKEAGLAVKFSGVDISPIAIAHAQQRAEQHKADVDFFVLDALREPLPTDFDVITSSLFLHHLEGEEAVKLLRNMSRATRSLVLVNDLIRSRPGYWLAWVGAHVLSASHVVHVDGPRSVEGAFTMPEALAMAEQAGMTGAQVAWRWPFRYLLSWGRPT